MLKKNIILILLSIILLFVMIIVFFPVKPAITEEAAKEKEEQYIIVQWTRVTGFDWNIVGDESGLYESQQFIKLLNNYPTGMNYDTIRQPNRFICYGTYVGEDHYNGATYKIFDVKDWDILYPVTGCLEGLTPYALTIIDFMNGIKQR